MPTVVPQHYFAISLTAACVLFILAMLLKWKPLHRIEFLIPWLLLAAGTGFAAAFLNGWVRSLAGVTTSIPIFGVAVMFVAAIVLCYIVAYDFWPKHTSNRTTEFAAVLAPAFSPYVGGAAGMAISQFFGWVAVAGATALGKLFGV
jgi:hypothetical protein